MTDEVNLVGEDRNGQARESMRKLHDRRRAMGICIYCSGMIDAPQYSLCEKCRAKKREENAIYRESLRKLHEKCFEPIPEEEKRIPEDHKCWTCVWSRFEGDRFFCPIIGTCVKEEKHAD